MTPPRYVDRAMLVEFLTQLGAALAELKPERTHRLYLIGETTQVFEDWRNWAERFEFTTESEGTPDDQEAVGVAVRRFQAEVKINLQEESPGDIIPLPAGHQARARYAGQFGALEVYHFDPYSVAFRLITRGDEADYRAVLTFLQHGWLVVDEMNALLAHLLPRFTLATIQQDPAEFRRKFRGLLQMWRATPPS